MMEEIVLQDPREVEWSQWLSKPRVYTPLTQEQVQMVLEDVNQMAPELNVLTEYEVAACKLLAMNATAKWRGYQIGHRDHGLFNGDGAIKALSLFLRCTDIKDIKTSNMGIRLACLVELNNFQHFEGNNGTNR